MVGLSKSITLSFMVAGHTKFSPDRSFGLLKKEFRRTAVDTLGDIVRVVERSATTNSAEVIGWEDGVPLIPTFNWTNFFAGRMLKIPGIKGYQHFHFGGDVDGKVECRVSWDSEPQKHPILSTRNPWHPTVSDMPDIISPNGLDNKRQWYLFDKIRPFCIAPESKDITCPLPSCPRPASSAPPSPMAAPPITEEDEEELPQPPASKRPRTCGRCGLHGHNIRTCPTATTNN